MRCRRIIVPVTFAHDSLEGAVVAADLAAALAAELVLAGIAPVAPAEPSADAPTAVEALQRQVEDQRVLDQIVLERLEDLAGTLADGAHLLHDHADRYVLHHSDVPVVVVPTAGRPLPVR